MKTIAGFAPSLSLRQGVEFECRVPVAGCGARIELLLYGARNERRRRALSVLVGRMAERGEVSAEAAADLTDLLFVLTSFTVFAELNRGRPKDAACSLVQSAAADAVNRARNAGPSDLKGAS